MAKKKYDVDYFIKKFKAIPGNKWTIEEFEYGDKCCALGHCGLRAYGGINKEGLSLIELFNKTGNRVSDINDGYLTEYAQKTPRSRILAALRDIKRKVNSV